MSELLSQDFAGSTRGRVIGAIRRGNVTVEGIANELDLTGNAVRAQLTILQRDGLVRVAGIKKGATRPAQTYELTPQLEQLLSRAYVPLLTHLVRLFAANEPAEKFEWAMREAGRALASELGGSRAKGTLASRVNAASEILNRELGASTHATKGNGGYVIRGSACPLAALTGKHQGVCLAIESLVGELVDKPVKECCNRDQKPRCCFHVTAV